MGLTAAKKPGFIGARFGRLVILGKAGLDKQKNLIAECRCDCEKIVAVRWCKLRSGETRSCGCLVTDRLFKNLAGRRFGKLTVVAHTGFSARRQAKWLCRCDCGVEVERYAAKLLGGRTTTCGCGRGRPKPPGEAARNIILAAYRRNASLRSLQWRLSEAQAFRMFSLACYYCGGLPSNVARGRGLNGVFVYNGIDRLDPTRGYVSDNVVPCCKTCNVAKLTMTRDEFLAWIWRVAARHPLQANFDFGEIS